MTLAAPPASPVFDLALLAENWGTADDPLYRRILGLFMAEAGRLTADLAAAHAVNDVPALHNAAHTLRAIAGNVCAMGLSRAAAALDESAPAASPADLAGLVATVQARWREVETAVAAGGPRHDR
jgi:HPt (histidine-containing phosphotransfer) domain-containing protein